MTGPLYALGSFVVRHARWVLLAWIAVAIATVLTANGAGRQTDDNLTLPGTGSTQATDTLDQYLPKQANGSVPIALESTQGRLDEGANRTAVEAATRSLRADPEVRSAISPLSSEGADNLSKDGRIGYIAVNLKPSPSELEEDEAERIIAAADPASEAGIEVAAGGYLGQDVSKPATESSEAVGLSVAIVVLLIAFGTLVAMPLPIVSALFGLAIGLALVGMLGHLVSVPSVAPTLGTMLGLGVGIDYALFIITRYRQLTAAGFEIPEAIARATATSGGAVVFAGSTVVVALLSLYFSGIPIVQALGYSAAIVVAVAIVAAITLLPAILALLGPRIDRGKVPFGGRGHDDEHPHGWARWAAGVGRRPVPAAILGSLLLVVLALPLLDIRLGQPDYGQMPTDTQARKSYDIIERGFGAGTNGPLLIAVRFEQPAEPDTKSLHQLQSQQAEQQAAEQQQLEQQAQAAAETAAAAGQPPPPSPQPPPPTAKQKQQEQQVAAQEAFLKTPASDPRLVKLQKQIGKQPDVDSVSPAQVDKQGSAGVFTATSASAPSAELTSDLVVHLRDDTIPAAEGPGMRTYVDGSTAGYIDLADRIGEKLPLVIAIVVVLSFFLLALAFRSLIVPLTAGLMNLLSVAAAYGVLVAVFEKGWGISLIGLDHEIPVVSFVPLLMFAILFGLSMDYQVFLLTRIQERYRKIGDNHDAVVDGLAGTARVITSAAMIMVAVFTSFVLNGDPTVKQFGVGLAAAIAIDATIVRTLLVPAVMVLVGKANWWLPESLERRMPNLGIEGDEVLRREGRARLREPLRR